MLLFPQYSETTKRKRTSALGTESIKTLAAVMAVADFGCWLVIKSATV